MQNENDNILNKNESFLLLDHENISFNDIQNETVDDEYLTENFDELDFNVFKYANDPNVDKRHLKHDMGDVLIMNNKTENYVNDQSRSLENCMHNEKKCMRECDRSSEQPGSQDKLTCMNLRNCNGVTKLSQYESSETMNNQYLTHDNSSQSKNSQTSLPNLQSLPNGFMSSCQDLNALTQEVDPSSFLINDEDVLNPTANSSSSCKINAEEEISKNVPNSKILSKNKSNAHYVNGCKVPLQVEKLDEKSSHTNDKDLGIMAHDGIEENSHDVSDLSLQDCSTAMQSCLGKRALDDNITDCKRMKYDDSCKFESSNSVPENTGNLVNSPSNGKNCTSLNKLYQGLLNDVLEEESNAAPKEESDAIRSRLKRIKRKDLEDMIIDQVVNKLLYDHELSYQKDVCKKMEKTLDSANKKISKLTEEVDTLQSVINKVSMEHKRRKSCLVYPNKVKRSVGIQANKTYISQGFSASLLPNSDVRIITPSKFQRPRSSFIPRKPLPNKLSTGLHSKSESKLDCKYINNYPTNNSKFLQQNSKNFNSSDQFRTPHIPKSSSSFQKKTAVSNGRLKAIEDTNGLQRPVSESSKLVSIVKPVKEESLHPAPLPSSVFGQDDVLNNLIPPEPVLRVHLRSKAIILSWNINRPYEEGSILSYQLFSYEETADPPSSDSWQKIGTVKALELPMACTLTQFKTGRTYHFAVRATSKKGRVGPFSQPRRLKMIPFK